MSDSKSEEQVSKVETKSQNEIYAERFEKLIRVMRGLTPHQRRKHFNMRQWGQRTDCGTTMCAAGYCGVDRWFKRQGFTMSERIGHPVYGGRTGWSAVVAFFGERAGDGEVFDGISTKHPVFARPRTVKQVIEAAQKRIKQLRTSA